MSTPSRKTQNLSASIVDLLTTRLGHKFVVGGQNSRTPLKGLAILFIHQGNFCHCSYAPYIYTFHVYHTVRISLLVLFFQG